MSKILFTIIILFGAIGVIAFMGKANLNPVNFVNVGNTSFKVDISDTAVKRELGLSYRKSLCDKCGMLFKFDNDDIYAIWMKDMKFDIDVIYFDSQMNIVDVKENFKKESFPEKYTNKVIAMYVLEVNAGDWAKSGANIGDKVDVIIDKK